jgi:hypothetical protein
MIYVKVHKNSLIDIILMTIILLDYLTHFLGIMNVNGSREIGGELNRYCMTWNPFSIHE